MGASLGLGYGTTDSKSSGTSANTYSGPQTDLQNSLVSALKTFLPGIASGSISPNVTAMQTQGADQINKTSSGLSSRIQSFLSQRGFGSSGTSGKVALQGELGRESALGRNASDASALQLQQNNGWLNDALHAAFEAIGGTGNSTGSGSSFGIGAGAGAGFTGIPGVKPL